MSDERPPRSDGDSGVDLRFAAMVAAHEQRKWNVVRDVLRVLDRVRADAAGKPRDDPTDPRAAA